MTLMELEHKMSVEDEMNRVLNRIGLSEWEAVWVPDSSTKVDGQVIIEQKTILVFAEDPDKARDALLHEVVEIKLRKLIDNHYDMINGLIKIIQDLNYVEKERTINELVPLIRHVFEE